MPLTTIENHLSPKPRRSVLYMPANNLRAMQKAQSLAADVIVFDLEDAVAPDQKANARELLTANIADLDFGGREVMLRVNGTDTQWHQYDIHCALALPISGIVLPKVESAKAVQVVIDVINSQISNTVMSADYTIWPMIETPTGVFAVRDIVNADAKVDCLVMGTSDLAKELRLPASPNREGLLFSLSQCVLAAAEKRIDVLDGVCLAIKDSDALEQQLAQGKQLGFTGKTLIHPSQIDATNHTFGISDAERLHAESVIAIWHEAEASGDGVAVLNGKLIENLHYADALRVLALAKAISESRL